MVISEGSDVVLTASSHKPLRRKHQWLQWDLGPPHLVTGVVTRSRRDTGRNHWVKAYTLTYSNDSKVWLTNKDDNHLDTKQYSVYIQGRGVTCALLQVFGGNLDKHTERRHYLNSPFKARYVRLHPQRWRKSIALRAALIGCPHTGDCGEGFFRVTPDTSCVENIAYKGSTWVNDKRHSWSDWNYAPASLAVDGNRDTTLQSCPVIDNDSVDEPVWMVDLGGRQQVRGLALLTWQGRGQDQQTLYRDYVFGLDRLTVFVENQRRLDTLSPQDHKKCASITRLNNALFRERVHVECPQPQGRENTGSAQGATKNSTGPRRS
ncbi:venom prothrombin activator omicarin-C non-catalytic subunit-like [Eriocheir sinensis]|uniref:venom prothrombin activator omicarin-C non-catalytic subunit-like n=1 Tax=Eriocheir sinensis TaxID=95602 RepID=UPI0021C835C4|nr:venom prothrombin activator omicarin-C non-catalytic subunit-like [Eriocheir sinensis]